MNLPNEFACGYFDCSEFGNLTYSPKRNVTKFEIEYYLADGYNTMADEQSFQIRKNYIQIAKPGQIRYTKLPFTTLYLKFSADGSLYDRLMNAPEYFQCFHTQETKKLLKEIILLNESAQHDSLLLYSKLLSLIHLILEDSHISKTFNKEHYQLVEAAKAYIEQNFSKNIKLSDIAASVNLSSIYFHKIFSDLCSCTPHEYLTRYRISRAKELLWNSDNSIGYISEICGFGCQQYMNQVFKKNLETTPGQYRKQMNKKYLHS